MGAAAPGGIVLMKKRSKILACGTGMDEKVVLFLQK
jgi:hypothetical protein